MASILPDDPPSFKRDAVAGRYVDQYEVTEFHTPELYHSGYLNDKANMEKWGIQPGFKVRTSEGDSRAQVYSSMCNPCDQAAMERYHAYAAIQPFTKVALLLHKYEQ